MMKTGDLIRTLSQDARMPKISLAKGLLACVGAALVYCVAAILTIRGMRPDFAEAVPWMVIKAGVSLAFAACAAPLVLRLARPGVRPGPWSIAGLALFALAAVTAVAAVAGAAPQDRIFVLTGGDFPHCIVIIPVIAIPAGGVLFFWLRKNAPTRPAWAGAAAGALAGGLSAIAYALTCPVDSIAFVATWYPVAIAICGALGALVGMRALRW